jgi:OOP family OmpA-OmpF porin
MAPLSLRIGFDEGGTALGKAALESLSDALASEQMKAGGPITLAGHSDTTGDDAVNLLVSRKRAEAVRDWLMAHGVAADRITVVAIGEQNPVAPNATSKGEPNPSGRAENRRVELRIKVPLGTPPAAQPSRQGTLVDAIAGD